MYPDDMLRAYAERKAAGANKGFGGAISTAQISYPVSAANTSTSSGNEGMRTLFNVSSVVNPMNTGSDGGYVAYEGGASYAIGINMMRVMWGITHMEGLLELYEMNEW